MTGDESYHAHCFTCRTCKRRIEELVFAKTTQGIYCMSCHNERVARSRRHAEAKRQRAARKERERAEAEKKRAEREGGSDTVSPLPGGVARLPALSTSTSLNLLASGAVQPPQDRNSSAPTSPTFQSNVRPASPQRSLSSPYAETQPTGKPHSREPSADRGSSPTTRTGARPGSPAFVTPRQGAPPSLDTTQISSRDWSSDNEVSRSATASPVMPMSPASPYAITSVGTPGGTSVQSSPSAPNLSGTLGTPQRNPSPMGPRSPTNAPGLSPSGGAGLGVPTTKASKRRSINPGMVFSVDGAAATFAAEPRAPSPLRTSTSDQPPRSSTPSTVTSPTRGANVSPESSEATVKAVSASDKERSSSPAPQSPETIRVAVPGEASPDRKAGPRISAPKLGNMSFSLSDPDFASLLQEMESSGKSAAEIVAVKEAREKAASSVDSHASQAPSQAATGESSASASPESPAVVTISHSPPVPNGSDKMPQQQGLLSPSDSKLPPAGTPRRRPSVESAISVRMDPENAIIALKELVASAAPDATGVSVDITLLNEIIREHDNLRDTATMLKNKYTGAKRSSQQYSEGLTIAGEEYDKEVALRRELEAENSRLRAQVHGQTARLSVISSDERRAESMRRRSQDLVNSLSTLERDISRLRAQRDISLAEVEELQATKGGVATGEMEYVDDAPGTLGHSLSRRLETIKEQYRDEIGPLSAQREVLQREINELRETKQQFLEESTSLAAKNEELAELNSQLSRQMESMENKLKSSSAAATLKPALHGHKAGSPSMSSLAPTLPEVQEETARVIRVPKPEPIEAAPARRFKWIKSNAGAKLTAADREKKNGGMRPSTEVGLREHNFQQHSTMRLGRCELCQDKMWGLQEVKCGREYKFTHVSLQVLLTTHRVWHRLSLEVRRQASEVVYRQGDQEGARRRGTAAAVHVRPRSHRAGDRRPVARARHRHQVCARRRGERHGVRGYLPKDWWIDAVQGDHAAVRARQLRPLRPHGHGLVQRHQLDHFSPQVVLPPAAEPAAHARPARELCCRSQ